MTAGKCAMAYCNNWTLVIQTSVPGKGYIALCAGHGYLAERLSKGNISGIWIRSNYYFSKRPKKDVPLYEPKEEQRSAIPPRAPEKCQGKSSRSSGNSDYLLVFLVLFKVDGLTRYIILTKEEYERFYDILEEKRTQFAPLLLTDVVIFPGAFFLYRHLSDRRSTFSEIFEEFPAQPFDILEDWDFSTPHERQHTIAELERRGLQDTDAYRKATGKFRYGSFGGFTFTDDQFTTVDVAIDDAIAQLGKKNLKGALQPSEEDIRKVVRKEVVSQLADLEDKVRCWIRKEIKSIVTGTTEELNKKIKESLGKHE